MDIYAATEEAYKNGYKQGQKDAAREILGMAKQAFLEMKGISFDEWHLYQYKIDEIAKQFGVKIDDGE